MIFKRKIYSQLLAWKRNFDGHSAVMVQGARRVGKSTVVEEFAKNEYKSYILVNFSIADDELLGIFYDIKSDMNLFFNRLQLNRHVQLYERESVIIFDEVQDFPFAREMIKYLVKDHRYDYIETGSLICVKARSASIKIPSEEHRLDMHPMDFEEWLWANGDDFSMDLLHEFFVKKQPLGDNTHSALMRRYREYMVVGGMPQVVEAYLRKHSVFDAEFVKKEILKLYLEDINKSPDSIRGRSLDLFNNVPAMLSSPHKILYPTKIEKGTRGRDYKRSLEWLCDAMLLNRCRCNPDPDLALGLNEDPRRVKCYFLDTGLLISFAFGKEPSVVEDVYDQLLDGNLSINQGMFFENAVAQQLVSLGRDLWFTEFGQDRSGKKYEVDFLLSVACKMVPIEVKSSKSTIHHSLDALLEKYPSRIGQAYVVHTGDLRFNGKITYLPIYMLPFILERRDVQKV